MSNSMVLFNNGEVNEILGRKGRTFDERLAIANAIASSPEKVGDHVNQELDLVNFYISKVHLTDSETGEFSSAVRTVLIGRDGEIWGCTSSGIINALKGLCTVFGMPDEWENSIIIRVKSLSRGKGRMLTFEIVGEGGVMND